MDDRNDAEGKEILSGDTGRGRVVVLRLRLRLQRWGTRDERLPDAFELLAASIKARFL